MQIPEQTAELVARLRNEAQIHAQEARTANATIAEIYRIVTGGTGEPGNWHGAEPVRKCIEDLRAALATTKATAPWQPIETAPKTSRAILVWCQERKNIYTVSWSEEGWTHFGGTWYLREEPTRWMPLPAGPDAVAPPPVEAIGEPVVADAAEPAEGDPSTLEDALYILRKQRTAFEVMRRSQDFRQRRIAELEAALATPATPSSQDAPRAVPAGLSDAVRAVLAERQRQISKEGWTPEHDDEHDLGTMAKAAACYALGSRTVSTGRPYNTFVTLWPWDEEWWKPTPNDRRRELVKSGALILAELERIDRAALAASAPGAPDLAQPQPGTGSGS